LSSIKGDILVKKELCKGKNSGNAAIVSNAIIFLIKLYQYTLSPLFGHTCRFIPTCSQYSIQAIKSHGLFAGIRLTVFRILKCHPWHNGGYDPVP